MFPTTCAWQNLVLSKIIYVICTIWSKTICRMNQSHIHLWTAMKYTRDRSFDDPPKSGINIKVIKILGQVVLEALWSNRLWLNCSTLCQCTRYSIENESNDPISDISRCDNCDNLAWISSTLTEIHFSTLTEIFSTLKVLHFIT